MSGIMKEYYSTKGEPQGKTDSIIIEYVRKSGDVTIKSLARGCYTRKWFGECVLLETQTRRDAKKWAAHHLDRLVRDRVLKFRQPQQGRDHIFYIP